MKRLLLLAPVLILVVIGIGYAVRGRLTLRLMQRVVAANLETDLVRELPDGLHLGLCGAGSPLPDPRRSGPCSAIIAGERLFIVDVGSGASRVLSQLRIPQGRIEAIFLTHFHSDHIDGLGELLLQRWVAGSNRSPTPVYGPTGVGEVVAGIQRAYAADVGYRVAHHGEGVVPPWGAGAVAKPFPEPADGETRIVLHEGELRIIAFRVTHPPIEPSVGYRFDYKGRSLVLSGDTTKSANLQRFAEGADLLVHEALAPEMVAVITRGAEAAGRKNLAKITVDIVDYHATPIEAAEVARDAAVGHLLYYHIVPPLPARALESLFLAGVDDVYTGPVTLGRDGTLVSLPVGSDAIEVDQLL
jgi:ribonuclease Z